MDSYLCDLCSDLSVSEGYVRKFIDRLGGMQDQQEAFMKSQVMPGTTILRDLPIHYLKKAMILTIVRIRRPGFHMSLKKILTGLYSAG